MVRRLVHGPQFSPLLLNIIRLCILSVNIGIRSGTDILKALALDTRAVLIRPSILYGFAGGEHDGIKRVLDISLQKN
ncbi:unnamed protein product [Rotaria sordida]|uniref:FMN-dependent dehydrogenase domain-containing protein n=1 Tax=Rotaria sordida TaxID=392033 RepID=A0A815H692_9BILA|nr:unnamed protein product [Rotaria sordida]